MTIKIYIVYYSMYGHIKTMANSIKKGVDNIPGCEGVLYQVPETLSDEVLEKMHAPTKDDSVPIITAHDLPNADGIIFGIPTRFGMACAQMKAFMDTTGSLWGQGKLMGKAAGIFVSTASQCAGQESTALTFVTQLAHHGMIFVPTGYHAYELQSQLKEVQGGSAWGSGTYAGSDGSRQPSENELKLAELQGEGFAKVAVKLADKKE